MKNWFDIIQPHEDIRKGDFDEAVFAADLGNVVDGSASPDYGDPYLFFRKTYLTDGLRHLLARVHGKLTTGKGQSVIETQTPFGGGKTHSLVTIYHYLKNGQKVRPLLPEGLDLLSLKMSVIVGTHHNPVEGRQSDGVTRRTSWGEIGYQLAGREGYVASLLPCVLGPCTCRSSPRSFGPRTKGTGAQGLRAPGRQSDRTAAEARLRGQVSAKAKTR